MTLRHLTDKIAKFEENQRKKYYPVIFGDDFYDNPFPPHSWVKKHGWSCKSILTYLLKKKKIPKKKFVFGIEATKDHFGITIYNVNPLLFVSEEQFYNYCCSFSCPIETFSKGKLFNFSFDINSLFEIKSDHFVNYEDSDVVIPDWDPRYRVVINIENLNFKTESGLLHFITGLADFLHIRVGPYGRAQKELLLNAGTPSFKYSVAGYIIFNENVHYNLILRLILFLRHKRHEFETLD